LLSQTIKGGAVRMAGGYPGAAYTGWVPTLSCISTGPAKAALLNPSPASTALVKRLFIHKFFMIIILSEKSSKCDYMVQDKIFALCFCL
jgi:hypothetical protein